MLRDTYELVALRPGNARHGGAPPRARGSPATSWSSNGQDDRGRDGHASRGRASAPDLAPGPNGSRRPRRAGNAGQRAGADGRVGGGGRSARRRVTPRRGGPRSRLRPGDLGGGPAFGARKLGHVHADSVDDPAPKSRSRSSSRSVGRRRDGGPACGLLGRMLHRQGARKADAHDERRAPPLARRRLVSASRRRARPRCTPPRSSLIQQGRSCHLVHPLDADSVSVLDVAARTVVHEVLLAAKAPSLGASGRYDPAVQPRAIAIDSTGDTLFVTRASARKPSTPSASARGR